MPVPNNPAGRLVELLEAASKGANDNHTMEDIWGRVFSIDSDNTTELFALYIELVNLVRDAKSAVAQIKEIDQELYLEPFNRLEQGFSVTSFKHNWQSFKKYLDPATMTGLRFCSELLSREAGERIISEKELAQLQKDVDDLLEEVLKVDMNPQLQTFIVERVEEIRRAILFYRINGADGLEKALEATIGAMYIFNAQRTADAHGDEKTLAKIATRFMKVVESLGKLVAFARNASGLLSDDLPKLIGPPS